MQAYLSFLILIVFIAILFGIGILIARLGTKECISDSCFEVVGQFKDSMDKSVKPCDNFYQFVCGNYGKSGTLGEGVDSLWEELERRQLVRVTMFLQQPLLVEDDRVLRAAKVIYRRCVDLDIIEREGTEPLGRVLSVTGGFPLIDGSEWDQSMTNWDLVVSEFMSFNSGFESHFIHIRVKEHVEEGERKVMPYFSIPPYLLNYHVPPSNKYHVEIKRDEYYNYMAEIFDIMKPNSSLSDIQKGELNETVTFKYDLLNLVTMALNCTQSKHFVKNKNTLTSNNLGDLIDLVNMMGDGRTSRFRKFVTTQDFLDYLKDLDTLVGKTHKRVIGNYVAFENIMQATAFLPKAFRDAYDHHFINSESGKVHKILRNRELNCAQNMKNKMATALTSLYLQQAYEKVSHMYLLDDMNRRIKFNLKKLLRNVDWMDEDVKVEAVVKIERTNFATPLPNDLVEMLTNKTDFNIFFSSFCLDFESTLEAYQSLGTVMHNNNILLMTPTRKWSIFNEDFDIFSPEVYYDATRNTVVIPMGFLRFPAFDRFWPKYLNYGGLGSTIAHVMFKVLDFESGSVEGEQPDWWTNDTINAYKERRQCILNQTNEYIVDHSGRALKDANCVEDMIDTVSGLNMAYISYQEYSLERFFPEPRLPIFEPHKINQLFFIKYAYYFCTKDNIKEFNMNMTELELGRVNNEFKVLNSLQNFPPFSEAFNCKPGDKMNPTTKCPVWFQF